ncbi:hypothetical protein PENTCL1PPCAC_23382 [Pristionchus entomophagus]|uniref:Uncharacterized protein n=1 Tax=Pristionchus entomophagus TaxID=358040 RepID=A0AAV5U4A2_9BILA|nr:hypothetical protein PENTCL1PPCAC_23382 [Pristionchus entomophagus]
MYFMAFDSKSDPVNTPYNIPHRSTGEKQFDEIAKVVLIILLIVRVFVSGYLFKLVLNYRRYILEEKERRKAKQAKRKEANDRRMAKKAMKERNQRREDGQNDTITVHVKNEKTDEKDGEMFLFNESSDDNDDLSSDSSMENVFP